MACLEDAIKGVQLVNVVVSSIHSEQFAEPLNVLCILVDQKKMVVVAWFSRAELQVWPCLTKQTFGICGACFYWQSRWDTQQRHDGMVLRRI